MGEAKVEEEHLLVNGNGSIDSNSSDFLMPLPDPFVLQTEANPDRQSSKTRKEEDSSWTPSKTSEQKLNDELPTNSLSNVRVRANEDTPLTPESSSEPKKDENGHVDTAAPFESVKEAVSKFGGIVDWKAHRVQTRERRKFVEQELEKASEEIPVYKKKSEEAEQAKEQALKDLDSTKRLIEELKLNLERAQTEERQAKQDSDLAKLRVEEMEQGIADESSVAAKAQLEVAKARHAAAASELVTVKSDLEDLRRDYTHLISEREAAVEKAQEAMASAKEIERAVENLTIELITTKETIEATHAAHLEAEEHRIGAAMARDQDASSWDMDLKQSEEELKKVNKQIEQAKDLKSKLDTASVLLQKLKDELAIYMQGKTGREPEGSEPGTSNRTTRVEILSALSVAKKSLEEVNQNIEKSTEEVKSLKMAAAELNAELENEKAVLRNCRQQDGKTSEVAAALASEITETRLELDHVRALEKEAREKLTTLPKKLQKVGEEVDHVKLRTEKSRAELQKVKDAAERAKSGANAMASRLANAQKEIEAARASEKLALGAISALQDTESGRSQHHEEPTSGGVTLSLEEYYALSKKAHEAEEEANSRVSEAMSQIDIAKESEMQSLTKLNQLNSELSARKEALNVALQKAEMAKEGKCSVEQELIKWRAESELRRKGDSGGSLYHGSSPRGSFDASSPMALNHRSSVRTNSSGHDHSNPNDLSPEGKGSKKKKRSFMPKFFMFLGRKKLVNSHKNA